MARLPPGSTVGPYVVEELLGIGAMGEVYRAKDGRLNRAVAIKILSPTLSEAPDFQARFDREARLLASLNHPHVAQIYGIEEWSQGRALVMELVAGDTLQDQIHHAARPMPLETALAFARQIAEALSAAHERGVIHRDLKPSNIKITPAGVVKVLDFGIAKRAASDAPEDAELATHQATLQGAIVGTAAYMSPEQAQGQPVDARTDIWAFGCVLYEMLTRRQAFEGDTTSATMAKVIEREPDWQLLPSTTPASIQRLIKRCLKKNRSERLRDIGDAGLEIADVLSTPSTATAADSSRQSARPWYWVAVAAMAVVAAGIVAWTLTRSASRSSPATATATEFGIRILDNHIATSLAVSPDSRYLAASMRLNVNETWVYSFESGESRKVPGSESYQWPFWSPDSTRFGIFGSGNIRVVSVPDGSSTILCQLPKPGPGVGGTWNAAGEILFSNAGQLFKIAATGGTPVALATTSEYPINLPQFVSDQRHFIFYDAPTANSSNVRLGSIDSAESRVLTPSDGAGVFVPPNRLLFVRGASLFAQTLNPTSLVLEGSPKLVTTNVAVGVLLMPPALIGSSTERVLAFGAFRGGGVGHLTWFDRAGQASRSLDVPPGGEDLHPSISPNGTQIAVNAMDSQTGDWDIWIVDAASGARSRLTATPGRDTDPIWSPDGREIVFVSNRSGSIGLYRKVVDGSAPEERLADRAGANTVIPTDWTRDGKYILFHESSPLPWTVYALPMFGSDRTPIQLLSQFAPYGAHVSPDGQWLAYDAFDTGPAEIYVQRFLAPGQKQQVSHGGGVHPRWTKDGRELVYWAIPGGIDAVEFQTHGDSFRIGARRTLVQAPVLSLVDARSHYDVTRDGSRVILRQTASTQRAPIRVILNWTERLNP